MNSHLLIYETKNFIVTAPKNPFVDRKEGGHVCLFPKVKVRDRSKLPPELAIEYMKLSMIIGEALESAMTRRGIYIGIVNYQDMGNWTVFKPGGPLLHMHIFGRAKTAVIQKYGDAVQLPHRETGFYDNFKSLNDDDIHEVTTDIQSLMQSKKYIGSWSES